MACCTVDTPVGRLYIEESGGAICALRSARDGEMIDAQPGTLLDEAGMQLIAYFAGERTSFDLPLRLSGTPFDQLVLTQLCAVPFGQLRTYGEIAAAIGKPGAARAVGRACGANPLLLLVPCHRIVGAAGRLTGFAAGLEMKRMLLRLEGHDVSDDRARHKRI